jgi:hypothetical protein
VSKVCSKARKSQKNHRPLKLDETHEKPVLQFVQDGFTSGKYVAQRGVLSFVNEHFQKTVTYGWLASFMERWEGIVIRTTVVPQEQLRLRIPRECLNDYVSFIKEYVPLVPAELIFNLDETSLSDWEERKTKLVIILSHASSSTLHYPINRAIRHHTLLCCVSGSGDAYSPLFITPHPKARRISEKGIRENIDLKLEIRQVPYVDTDLFNQYIKKIFIQTVAASRELPGCTNKPTILFCDNCASHCASHCSEEILRELAQNGILVLTYPRIHHIFFKSLMSCFLVD